MPLTLQILLYALVAAFSPIVLVTTLTVLLSGRGRLNGIMFAVGFLAAELIVCGIGFALGAAATSEPFSGETTILGVLEILLGVALLGDAGCTEGEASGATGTPTAPSYGDPGARATAAAVSAQRVARRGRTPLVEASSRN